jgi:hypothetical protein
MARASYQYETSPRKVLPDYSPYKETNKIKKDKKISKEQEKQKQLALKQEKRKHHKNIAIIVGVFLVLLAISYRNSLITERFNEIQDKKQELAAIEKTNGQLEVSIEGSLNLNNLEESAEEKLGMQKLQNDQKVYVTLPKKDYTEAASDEVTEETESSWIQNLIDKFFK